MFGTAAGTVTVVLETLVMSFWLRPQSRAPQRVLFNAAAPAVAIWVSGTAFYWFSGIMPFCDTQRLYPCSSCHWRCLPLSTSF